jgi:hypothetical protein
MTNINNNKQTQNKIKTKNNNPIQRLLLADIKFQMSKLYKILIIIFISFFNINKREIASISRLFVKITRIWKSNGLDYTIKYIKSVRLYTTRYMVGDPLVLNEHLPIKVAVDKDMFPKLLSDFKHLVTSSKRWDVVRVLTLVTISRCFKRFRKHPLKVDYSSITALSGAKFRTLDILTLKKVISSLKLPSLKIKDLSWKDYKIFTSAGPHGVSTATAYDSLAHFTEQDINHLCNLVPPNSKEYLLREWNKSLPVQYVPSEIEVIEENVKKLFKQLLYIKKPILEFADMLAEQVKCSPYIRRLSIVEDPELKARVVGIFDHWSQSVLNLLSMQVFDFLKTIPSDRTYTQDPYFSHIGFEPNDSKYWSMDLSSATDRFPIELQTQVLYFLGLTQEEVDSWKYLMVGKPFLPPVHPSEWDNYKPLHYSVGQPMGGRSSWPIFTLTHHILIKYCALKLGIVNFHNYIILGDDIVIKHDAVALYYKDLLTKLGVEISVNKTHVSKTHYEFAKRWICPIGEISPLPLNGIVTNISNVGVIFQIFYELVIRRKLILPQIGNFTKQFSLLYSEISKHLQSLHKVKSFKPLFIKLKNKGKIMKFHKVITVSDRVYAYNLLLRIKSNLLTYDEYRFLFTSLKEHENTHQIPTTLELMKEWVSDCITIMCIKISDKMFKKVNNIANNFILDGGSGNDAVNRGYIASCHRVTSFLNMKTTNKTSGISITELIENVMSLEEDTFKNREGSSRTKKMTVFNRFANKFYAFFKNSNYNTFVMMNPWNEDQCARNKPMDSFIMTDSESLLLKEFPFHHEIPKHLYQMYEEEGPWFVETNI